MTDMAEGKQSGYRQLFVNLENNVSRGASQPWSRQLYLHEGDTCLESRLTPSELCDASVLVHTAAWRLLAAQAQSTEAVLGERPALGTCWWIGL